MLRGNAIAGVENLTRKRSETVGAFLAGLAGAAIVLLGDQTGPWLWVWHYLRWVSWPLRIGLAVVIVAVSIPAVQALLASRLAPPADPLAGLAAHPPERRAFLAAAGENLPR